MNYNKTVAELKAEGIDVKVKHERTFVHRDNVNKTTKGALRLSRKDFVLENYPEHVLDNHGGITTVTLTLPDGGVLVGEARCSDLDQFNRRRGLCIALGRALRG